MSDRTGAQFAGEVFEILAQCPDDRSKLIARAIWEGPWRRVDATWHQLDCDEALLALDLIVQSPPEAQDDYDCYMSHEDIKEYYGR